MKYAIRTVIWRFKESIELAPEFAGTRSVTIRTPEAIASMGKAIAIIIAHNIVKLCRKRMENEVKNGCSTMK